MQPRQVAGLVGLSAHRRVTAQTKVSALLHGILRLPFTRPRSRHPEYPQTSESIYLRAPLTSMVACATSVGREVMQDTRRASYMLLPPVHCSQHGTPGIVMDPRSGCLNPMYLCTPLRRGSLLRQHSITQELHSHVAFKTSLFLCR